MPQVEKVKLVRNHRPARFAVSVVIGVLILAGLVAGYVAWSLIPKASEVVTQADTLDGMGKYSDALTKLQMAQPWAWSKSDKALILSRLAATKYDMGKYQEALTYYKQLDNLQPNNAGTLESMGEVAVQAGDKATAISAYQQAIPIMQSGPQGPTTAANIQALKKQVAEMQQ